MKSHTDYVLNMHFLKTVKGGGKNYNAVIDNAARMSDQYYSVYFRDKSILIRDRSYRSSIEPKTSGSRVPSGETNGDESRVEVTSKTSP